MRVLWGAGGGFKGAFDVPILNGLDLDSYDEMGGTSVMAVNGSCAATRQLDVMNKLWAGLDSKNAWDGVEGFLAPTWHKWALTKAFPPLKMVFGEINSLFSMDPLEAKVGKYISADKLVTPFSCGIVVRETRKHHTLRFTKDDDTHMLRKGILSSASIAFIMNPHRMMVGDKQRLCSDGGHDNVLPYMPFELKAGDELDAIVHFPLKEMEEEVAEVDGFFESLEWFLEMQFAAQRKTALAMLQGLADRGVKVRVFAPKQPLGGLLKATRAIVDWRQEEGDWALKHPVLMKPS